MGIRSLRSFALDLHKWNTIKIPLPLLIIEVPSGSNFMITLACHFSWLERRTGIAKVRVRQGSNPGIGGRGEGGRGGGGGEPVVFATASQLRI